MKFVLDTEKKDALLQTTYDIDRFYNLSQEEILWLESQANILRWACNYWWMRHEEPQTV